MNRDVFLRRGDIWLVNFNPSQGSEQRGIRPALIVQNDVGNEVSPVTIVAAISSVTKTYPINVEIKPSDSGLEKDSVVKLNQIRTIEKKRLIKRLGRLDSSKMKAVNLALMLSLGLQT